MAQWWGQAQELLLSLLLVESFPFCRTLGLTCYVESIAFADGLSSGAAQVVALALLSQSEAL